MLPFHGLLPRSEINDGGKNRDGQDKHQPFEVVAGKISREVEHQNGDREDVEKREKH